MNDYQLGFDLSFTEKLQTEADELIKIKPKLKPDFQPKPLLQTDETLKQTTKKMKISLKPL